MSDIRNDLLEFFMTNYKPGAIGLVGTRDTIGMAIRAAQSLITKDRHESLWSHCFIFNDLRLDRRGDDNSLTKSLYLFESDLKVNAFKPQLRNGAQENWIGKWCNHSVENAAIIDLNLSGDQKDIVRATALQLIDEQVLYPIQELLGTWWAIITQQEWEENPADDPHAMYCSSFVRYCYSEAGKDFLDSSVSISNTTPEHIAQAGTAKNAITVFGR
jgi:hypothetical protein